jgi:hypothetical protein
MRWATFPSMMVSMMLLWLEVLAGRAVAFCPSHFVNSFVKSFPNINEQAYAQQDAARKHAALPAKPSQEKKSFLSLFPSLTSSMVPVA